MLSLSCLPYKPGQAHLSTAGEARSSRTLTRVAGSAILHIKKQKGIKVEKIYISVIIERDYVVFSDMNRMREQEAFLRREYIFVV